MEFEILIDSLHNTVGNGPLIAQQWSRVFRGFINNRLCEHKYGRMELDGTLKDIVMRIRGEVIVIAITDDKWGTYERNKNTVVQVRSIC